MASGAYSWNDVLTCRFASFCPPDSPVMVQPVSSTAAAQTLETGPTSFRHRGLGAASCGAAQDR
ncbi:hypothetical protein LH612_31705, partial [Klebsiella pneumoniae]|nr:hypothetical protein [Klebsiella pneumoniae]